MNLIGIIILANVIILAVVWIDYWLFCKNIDNGRPRALVPKAEYFCYRRNKWINRLEEEEQHAKTYAKRKS